MAGHIQGLIDRLIERDAAQRLAALRFGISATSDQAEVWWKHRPQVHHLVVWSSVLTLQPLTVLKVASVSGSLICGGTRTQNEPLVVLYQAV